MPESRELPRYKCHKEVHALKISAIHKSTNGGAFLEAEVEAGLNPIYVPESYVIKHDPKSGGYYVVYEDGYKSFSPAKAFEEGYALVGTGNAVGSGSRC